MAVLGDSPLVATVRHNLMYDIAKQHNLMYTLFDEWYILPNIAIFLQSSRVYVYIRVLRTFVCIYSASIGFAFYFLMCKIYHVI